jgi:hypothetical protein
VSLTITGQATVQETTGSGVYTKYTASVVARSPSVVYALPLDDVPTQQWTLTFRYSEVYDLHARLLKKAFVSTAPLPKLPSRKLFGSSVSDDFVQQRSNSLQAYAAPSPPYRPFLKTLNLFRSSRCAPLYHSLARSYFQSLCALPLITLDTDVCTFLNIVPPLAHGAQPVATAHAVLTKVNPKTLNPKPVTKVACAVTRATCAHVTKVLLLRSQLAKQRGRHCPSTQRYSCCGRCTTSCAAWTTRSGRVTRALLRLYQKTSALSSTLLLTWCVVVVVVVVVVVLMVVVTALHLAETVP